MKKKHLVRNWILGSSLAITIAGTGSFFAYFFINQHFQQTENAKNNAPLKNIGLIQKNDAPTLGSLSFNQYPIEIKPDGTQVFAFTDEQMKQIMERFVNEIPFGPEVYGLKSITFNDINLINSDGVNGIYYPQTNQMGISTKSILKDSDLLSWDEKIDQVFQVIYHEYGHHLFYTYVSSTLDQNHATEIGGQPINTEFYKWFQTAFNYNSKAKTQKSTGIFNANALEKTYQPISNTYSLKELYDHANNNIKLKGDPEAKFDYFYYDKQYDPFSIRNSLVSFPVEKADHSTTQYMYSLQELLTRKFQLSTMAFSNAAKNTINPRRYSFESGGQQYYRAHTNVMSQDINHYSTLLLKNPNRQDKDLENRWNTILESINGVPVEDKKMREEKDDYIISHFYKDNPFLPIQDGSNTQVAEAFFKKVGEMMGQQKSAELSYINSKNTLEIQRSKKDKVTAAPSTSETWKDDQGNEIIVGGYLDHTKHKSYLDNFANNIDKPKFLAIKSDKDQDKFAKIADIVVTEKDLKAKSKPYEAIPEKDIAGSDYFWTTKNYFKAADIENKLLHLVFEENGKLKAYPITTYKGMDSATVAKTGVASNWLSSYPISATKKTDLWKFVKAPDNDGYPILKNEGIYPDLEKGR